MEVNFVDTPPPGVALAILARDGLAPSAPPGVPGDIPAGAIQGLKAAGFTCAAGKVERVLTPSGLLLVVGTDSSLPLSQTELETAAARACRAAAAAGAETIALAFDGEPTDLAHAALGARLAGYRFAKYRTRPRLNAPATLSAIHIVSRNTAASRLAYEPLAALAEGVELCRDLVNEPPNLLFPESFAERCRELAALGVAVEVLDHEAMQGLGMQMLLAVGTGSARDSRLVTMSWRGAADPSTPPLAFVGKGVCFDTGGISIKPSENMEEMKADMGGAAAVVGLLHTLATRQARVNVVGVIGLVENMPDGAAARPSDVATSMAGLTVEIVNTDAEGRLVLGDALWYAQQRFKPPLIVDLATLTGAMGMALGPDYAGLFSNDETLATQLLDASQRVGEGVWRMPLPPQYDRQLDSAIADIKNIGGRPAGSITAALFLQRFIDGVPWAHLDIAPIAWRKSDDVPTVPEGATGFGVRLLDQFVRDHFEAAA